MDHNGIRHKLSEYIDGAVTPQERAAIDEHLETCAECSDALSELRRTIEQVKQIDEVEAPAWMASKIMAQVREEADQKRSFFHRFFFPLSVKLPIQAVAVLFLTVTAYYVYFGLRPAQEYAEAPAERRAKQEAPAAGKEPARPPGAGVAARQADKVAQGPGYRSLDMKYEYEKPAPPVPQTPQAAPAPAPARSEEAASARDEAGRAQGGVSSARIAVAPSSKKDQVPSSAAAVAPGAASQPSQVPGLRKDIPAEAHTPFERRIIQRHPNGQPMTVVTEEATGSGPRLVMTEHFDENGERHGAQEEYYGSGAVKVRAQYDHGKLAGYREYEEDGTTRPGKSKMDWLWLKEK